MTPLTVDLGNAEFWQDPHAVWREARQHGRTARTPKGEVILLDAADFDLVHTDVAFGQLGVAALERLGMVDGPFHAWRAHTMAAHDGAVHDRLRGSLSRSFNPRRVEPLRAALRAHAMGVLAQITHNDRLDIVSDYASDLPLWLICEFLGLPQSSRHEIDTFLTGTEEGFTDPPTADGRQRAEEGIVALSHYVEELVAQRTRSPGEDLVSDLVASESAGVLSRQELIALVVNVIGGSVGSSRAGIANSILLMLQHSEQAEWTRGAPERIRPAIEECLRFHPPFRTGRRKALVATERFGVRFEPGETVLLARQSANRDPRRWADPDHFDVTRPELRHYSFGWGAHFCLGNALARLDIQVAVATFLDQVAGAQLVDTHPRRIPFTVDEQLESLVIALPGRSTMRRPTR
jgi:cytochrome P450